MRTILSLFATFLITTTPPTPVPPQEPPASTVLDLQGSAFARPLGRDRWTPLAAGRTLARGDLLKTEPRGANALDLTHAGVRLLLGPGGLLELGAGEVRLHRGDLEVKPPASGSLRVVGPDGASQTIAAAQVLRARDRALERLAEPPRWLTGFRASTTDEWMGALVAQVDGRDVPLHVGEHKVDVVIQSAVAETMVTQTFVNTTDSRLEGRFTFPLPADAAISGFAMWVGDEMVEADVVEKQRARQIYEDILRKRKDPGLLEWSGGNLFQARVFPIEARSEKRIRIRYTQVLRAEGQTLRYRYALRSELMRAHPVRKLAVRVAFAGAKLQSAASTSHSARVQTTASTALLEFDAGEYRPERDFEAVFTVPGAGALALDSHRRGDDGYFLLRLTAPDGGGLVRAPAPAAGEPLELLVLCDTSGSMDRAQRDTQQRFLRGLLGSLGERDRFALMTCDVTPRSWQGNAVPATEANVTAALTWLEQRPSLGWTDLDSAFTAAAARCSAKTLPVYVGDGIATSGDGDVAAQSSRLRGLVERTGARWHVVTTGAAFEASVLEAVATGSLRAADQDPLQAAGRLLADAAQPMLHDLRVEFEGLRVARVYPTRLPALATGAQQLVLGRFLPAREVQVGKVIVTGSRDGKPVRFTTEVRLDPADAGNSFLPRLWARQHVDALLAQGGPRVQQEVIAYSEEFGIITPYTSFLVLENDADREQYGVARRVKMRDGEQLFASARDAVTTEALREQLRQARAWRLRLREQMLREIRGLGIELHSWQGARGSLGRSRGKRQDWSEEQAAEPASAPVPAELSDFAAKEGNADDAGEVPADEESERAQGKDEDDFLQLDARRNAGLEGKKLGLAKYSRDRNEVMMLRSELAAARAFHVSPQGLESLGFPWLVLPATPAAVAATWDPEVVALLARLDRRPALAALDGGLRLSFRGGAVHRLRKVPLPETSVTALLAAKEWFARHEVTGQETLEQWLAGGERGVLATGKRLGRVRPAVAADTEAWPVTLPDDSRTDFATVYAGWSATIGERGPTTVVILRPPAPQDYELRLTIELERGVLVRREVRQAGKTVTTTRFADFAEAGGRWLARSIETLDDQGRVRERQTLTCETLPKAAFAAALTTALRGHESALLVEPVAPTLAASKQAVHDGKATVLHHLVLLLDEIARQQWDAAFATLTRVEALAPKIVGPRWIRAYVVAAGRRGAELQRELAALADTLPQPAIGTWFLAQQLEGFAASVLGPTEQLALHERLRPHARGTFAELQWQQRQAQLLQAGERHDDALAVLRAAAAAHPEDLACALAFLRALTGRGDTDGVSAFATQLQTLEWEEPEREQIFTLWTDALHTRGRTDELLAATARWIATGPGSETAYSRHLSALLFAGRDAEVDAILTTALGEPPKTAADRGRLGGALAIVLGNGWGFWARHVDPRFGPALTRLGRQLAAGDSSATGFVDRILGEWRFRQTPHGERLLAGLRADLLAALPELELDALERHVRWLAWGREQADDASWRRVVDDLNRRLAAAKPGPRQEPARCLSLLLTLHDQRGETAAAIGLLRSALAAANETERPSLAQQLFTRLGQQPWSESNEDELLALAPRQLAPDADLATRRSVAAASVRWLTDRLFELRVEALLGPVAAREQLPRAELRRRQAESRQLARTGLAARFQRAAAAADEAFRPWLELERLGLLARAETDPRTLEPEARELLAAIPADVSEPTFVVLRERCLLVLAFGACARQAPAELGDGALRLLEEQATAWPEALDWRYQTFRLLVGLDRMTEVERLLRQWIEPAKVENRWRIALAWLLAGRSDLEPAIAQLQLAHAADPLPPEELRALADWQFVVGDDRARERARLAYHEALPEHLLAQRVDLAGQRAQAGSALEPDTLLALRALLRRASHPANHVGRMQTLYRAQKDTRVLEALADGVGGHSAEAVYAFLQQTAAVFGEVHEEATCDSVRARIATLASAAGSPLERRALLLLELQAARRAAEVLNQAQVHADQACAMLRQAYQHEWQPGEPLHYARLLLALRWSGHRALATEILAELNGLQSRAPAGSAERLALATCFATALHQDGQKDQAIDLLTVVLAERRQAHGGTLPTDAHDVLGTLVDWLEAGRRHADAERMIDAELASLPSAAERRFTLRRERLWLACFVARGTVALGTGPALYRAARERILTALRAQVEDRPERLGTFCELHRAAREGDDLATFAATILPGLLTGTSHDPASLARPVAHVLRELQGPRAALTVYVDLIQREPAWRRRVGQNLFAACQGELADLRRQTKVLGELEAPLLAIVLRELEYDLRHALPVNNCLAWRHQGGFWNEKAGDFATVARRVLETGAEDPAVVRNAATYLWSGLDRFDEAIAALEAAAARDALEREGRFLLAGWLVERSRFDDALAHVQLLIAAHPDELRLRTFAIRVHGKRNQRDAADAVAAAAETRWTAQSRIGEGPLTELADACQDAGLFARAAGLWERIVPLIQRTHPGRGVGGSTLSRAQSRWASCLGQLGRHEAAVDQACAAIVSCGRDPGVRQGAQGALHEILAGIADLPGFVRGYDAKARASGQDAPLLRKAFGKLLLQRDAAPAAIAQLELAAQLEPEDPETHQLRVAAYDKTGDAAGAIRALRAAMAAAPAAAPLAEDLARRLDVAGDAEGAERARTQAVEARPDETEGHAQLAKAREAQQRFADAAAQWRCVTRIRKLEPDGFLSLAEALLQARDPAAAREVLEHVLTTNWESRFGNVKERAARMLATLRAGAPR